MASQTAADVEVFRAIADPTRRALLDQLRAGPRWFGELHASVPLTKGALSQHLRILREAGLVTSTAHGRRSRFELAPAPLREVAVWVDRYEQFWDEALRRLDTLMEGHVDE